MAGAGSGKTRVLTHRIAYLLGERGRAPGRDPRDHLHQQGRRRDEGAGGGAGRPARPDDVGVDLPLRLRAHPARRARARSACSRLLDLRRGRLAAADDDWSPGSWTSTPSATRRAALAPPGLQPQERAGRPGGVRRAGPTGPNERVLSPRPTRVYQRRLREAHALDFDDLIMTTVTCSRRSRHVAENYRRRFRHVLVDEYQDTNHAQYVLVPSELRRLRRPTGGRTPARAVRGRRRRPVDLRLPRRDHPQHPRVRARLPERHDDPAGAELPLHPDHPHRRQRGDRPEHPAASRRTCGPTPGAGEQIVGYVADTEHDEADWVASEIDRLADAGDARRATWRCSTGPTPSPGSSRRCSSGSACPTRWSAGCASTSARRSATRWPTCGRWPTPTTRSACARILNVPAPGHRRPGRGDAWRRSPSRERISFGAALRPGRRGARHRRPRRSTRSPSSSRCWRACARDGRDRRRPAEVLEAVLDRTGYLTELEASHDPQDEGRVENLQELVSVAREYDRADRGAGRGRGSGHRGRLPGAGGAGRRR